MRKSRDHEESTRRVKSDIESLKTFHELGGAVPEDSGERIRPPEELSQEELAEKMGQLKNEAIKSLKQCDSYDIAAATQGLLDELSSIDPLEYGSAKKISQLGNRIEQFEQELPVVFRSDHFGTISTLAGIPLDLRKLAQLCSLYQEKLSCT